jgi:hypothetical protein
MQSTVCLIPTVYKTYLQGHQSDLRKHLQGLSLKSVNNKYLIFILDIPLCCINCRILINYHQHNTVMLMVINYLLTHSMQQSPSWEANWFSANHEIPHTLWELKCPPSVPILNHINPVHNPTSQHHVQAIMNDIHSALITAACLCSTGHEGIC